MKDIQFTKISATGNDFIVFDNYNSRFHAQRDRQFFSRLCQRRISIGADGVILIEPSDVADFRYIHINSDGSIAEMCGNGSRAAVYFVHRQKKSSPNLNFEISGNVYHATLNGNYVITDFHPPDQPQFKLNIVEESQLEEGGFINTGVPHFVIFTPQVDEIDVASLGGKYCHHHVFAKGANVDFCEVVDSNTLRVRTFERGVEAETLACGTGSVACAIIASIKRDVKSPTEIQQPGGVLRVEFDQSFKRVALGGGVEPVFNGTLILETK